MSELSFGIPIKSKKEGDLILKAIETPEFKKIIESTKWSAFHTDYRMFKYFKPDFYKYFLDKGETSPIKESPKKSIVDEEKKEIVQEQEEEKLSTIQSSSNSQTKNKNKNKNTTKKKSVVRTKNTTCKVVSGKKRCEKYDGPMDNNCTLSDKNRCVLKDSKIQNKVSSSSSKSGGKTIKNNYKKNVNNKTKKHKNRK